MSFFNSIASRFTKYFSCNFSKIISTMFCIFPSTNSSVTYYFIFLVLFILMYNTKIMWHVGSLLVFLLTFWFAFLKSDLLAFF